MWFEDPTEFTAGTRLLAVGWLQRAVLACPPMRSSTYLRALLANGRRELVQAIRSFPFWEASDPLNLGISQRTRDSSLATLRSTWSTLGRGCVSRWNTEEER